MVSREGTRGFPYRTKAYLAVARREGWATYTAHHLARLVDDGDGFADSDGHGGRSDADTAGVVQRTSKAAWRAL